MESLIQFGNSMITPEELEAFKVALGAVEVIPVENPEQGEGK